MVTALNVDVSILKEKRWSSGKEAVNAFKLYAFQHLNCAMVHTRRGMFRNLVCSSADAGCTYFVNIFRVIKGVPDGWHVTRTNMVGYQ